MDVEILPITYHKASAKDDSNVYITDTDRTHTHYLVKITEEYAIEDEDILLDAILRDLGRLTETLQELKRSRHSEKEQEL